jgi:hypothetical protein
LTALYSVALFASAFLLFCIEPLVAKMLLPVAGGAPAVWSTCLVFFQLTLLAGYAFTQAALRRARPRVHALVYFVLFPVAIAALPITMPHRELGAHPALSVLGMLGATALAPFFVLSTLAPALQRWFATRADDPYFLYAASNVGSLAALVAYPLFIEPSVDLDVQSRVLRAAFVVLAVLVGACAFAMRDAPVSRTHADAPPIAWSRRARWVVLAAIPSAQLVAVTAHVTTTIAPAPLLWAVPLAAYLASFVIVFSKRTVPHAVVARRLPFVVVVGLLLLSTGANHPEWLVITLHVLVLLFVAIYCHGAMVGDRPPAARLPEFYTWMSVGGAVGGVAAALVAPIVLKHPIEYPLCLVFALACLPSTFAPAKWVRAVVVGAVAVAFACHFVLARGASGWIETAAACAPILVAYALDRHARAMTWALAGIVVVQTASEDARNHVIVRERSFFGAFAVVRDHGVTALMHGSTLHGLQRSDAPREAALYYSKEGPVGDVIELVRPRLRNAAVVGLGTGTLATYARPGEHWRYFELDPAVIRIARDPRYFTFLGEDADVVAGDARIELAKDDGRYDLLVIDAFTSDAIPTHLLTREALATYLTRLAPHAVIAWHVSNRYLDLRPVLGALADDARLAVRLRDDGALGPDREKRGHQPSLWIAMAEAAADLPKDWAEVPRRPGFRVWTDERASIVTVWR